MPRTRFSGLVRLVFLLCCWLASPLHAQPPLQWVNTMGLTGNDIGYFCAVDATGNSYLCGTFVATVDFDAGAGTYNLASAGGADAFLAKYDPAGNFLWAVRWGSAGFENAYRLAVDAAGNVVVTGNFNGTVDFDPGAGTTSLTSGGSGDPYAVKFDAAGNFQWVRAFTTGNGGLLYQPVLDAAGNVYLSGYYDMSVDADPGAGTVNYTSAGLYDVFFGKYDPNGNYIWSGAIRSTGYDFGNSIAVDGSGNVYIAGGFSATADFDIGAGTTNLTASGGQDIYFAKYNSSGALQFARRMGGSGDDGSNHIMVDGSGNIYVMGRYNGTVDFDPGAGASNLTNLGGQDGFVAKYDAAGNYAFAFRLGGTGTADVVTCGAFSADGGHFYVKGNYQNTVDFDPGAGAVNRTGSGTNTDLYFAKYSTAGAFVWVGVMGNTSIDNAYSICADNTGAIWVSGSFQLTVDFDVTAGIVNRTSNGNLDAYLAKYQDGVILPAEGNRLHIRPDQEAQVLHGTVAGSLHAGMEAWVERADPSDPTAFQTRASIPALPHSFTDADVLPGQRYFYRLRYEDADGAVTYGATVEGMLPLAGQFELYPNPARDGLLQLRGSGVMTRVVIWDAAGREVFSREIQDAAPEYSWDTGLPAGAYRVGVRGPAGLQVVSWQVLR